MPVQYLQTIVVSISGAVKKTNRIYGRVYRPKEGNLELVFRLFSVMLGVKRTFKLELVVFIFDFVRICIVSFLIAITRCICCDAIYFLKGEPTVAINYSGLCK